MNESAYAKAGVDIEAGERAVELMKESVAKSYRAEVLGGLGGFAGFFDATSFKKMSEPVLVSSTDGVGTKVAIASALDKHDTIGFDLIGMLVDDLVVTGAEPLFVTDYIACGKVVPERIAAIVGGIAQACVAAGCSLVGGETAEHPGLLGPEEYDLAGATTGVVEKSKILGSQRVQVGDVVVGMASSGLHSNGYSLVRKVLLSDAGWKLESYIQDFGRTLGEELLEPTRVYALDVLAMIEAAEIHAFSHITGGGLANNLARVLPNNVSARLQRSSWMPAAIFQVVREVGKLRQEDLDATLNMGVGMTAIMPTASVDSSLALLRDRGIDAWVLGEIIEGDGSAFLI